MEQALSGGVVTVAYIGATILFILALGGLSNPETARRGNVYGMTGMGIALVATIFGVVNANYALLIGGLAIGGTIGLVLARRVQMTQMPELVAILHSLVGLAAVFVGFASFTDPDMHFVGVEQTIHDIEIYLGILIGAVTFSGSVIAFGKLSGKISGNPLLLPARHWLNLGLLLFSIWIGAEFVEKSAAGERHGRAADHDRHRIAVRHPHGHGHRRRRHAGRRVDAEQLLRAGPRRRPDSC